MPVTINYEERLVAGLKSMGLKENFNTRTTKYRVFSRSDMQFNYYVGSKGALRQGRSVVDSHSIGDPSNQTPTYKIVFNGEVLNYKMHLLHPELIA